MPSCQDGLSQLPAKYHNTDLLLPQRAGVGHERHPLPDHALALLLHPPLRGQLAEGEAQVPQLQDSAGEVQQLLRVSDCTNIILDLCSYVKYKQLVLFI